MTGPKGYPGLPGQDGIPGTIGMKGDEGLNGLPGLKGDRGYTGLDGPKGDEGIPGLPGARGEPVCTSITSYYLILSRIAATVNRNHSFNSWMSNERL